MDLAHCTLTPDFTFLYFSGGGMNYVRIYMIYARISLFVVFSLGYSTTPEWLESVL